MQAIKTAYLPATDTRGSRVKASAAAGSIILHWDDALDSDQNHKAAAMVLATRLGWSGHWLSGGMETKSDSFTVWVCDTKDARDSFTVGG